MANLNKEELWNAMCSPTPVRDCGNCKYGFRKEIHWNWCELKRDGYITQNDCNKDNKRILWEKK